MLIATSGVAANNDSHNFEVEHKKPDDLVWPELS
jgi:hypothetical protein